VVEGVDFGLGFNSFVFVGSDHFWGGNYNVYVFNEERSRVFFEHSDFHAGYRMEGGHFVAEGLGRDHISLITHREIVVERVVDVRRTEETHNFAQRTAEHKELAHVVVHPHETGRPEAGHAAGASHAPEVRAHATGTTPERVGATSGHPAAGNAATTHPGANTEHGVTHTAETHSAAPGYASSAHPGTTEAHGVTPHTAETHSTAPGYGSSVHPGATAPNSKPPLARPGQSSSHTNQPSSGPR
jgi:hypothetical protein